MLVVISFCSPSSLVPNKFVNSGIKNKIKSNDSFRDDVGVRL